LDGLGIGGDRSTRSGGTGTGASPSPLSSPFGPGGRRRDDSEEDILLLRPPVPEAFYETKVPGSTGPGGAGGARGGIAVMAGGQPAATRITNPKGRGAVYVQS
jgi:hypothetical protein